MASKTTEWRHRTGRCKPRPAPPGHDAAWCAAHEEEIREWADHGVRQACRAARDWWQQWETIAPDEVQRELRAVAMLRICQISAHPNRDCPGFMVVAARWSCQSHIRQHIIGWQKRVYVGLLGETTNKSKIGLPENCVELVAQLMVAFPGDHWDNWRDHPAETGALLRQMIGATGAREVA